MGESTETILTPCECQIVELRQSKDLSRGSKADRCGSKGQMGTRESAAKKESGLAGPTIGIQRPGLKSGLLDFTAVLVSMNHDACCGPGSCSSKGTL